MVGGSAIVPTSGDTIVDVIDGSIMDIVVMEEDVDISLNDEEALPEVLESDEEYEDEDSKR